MGEVCRCLMMPIGMTHDSLFLLLNGPPGGEGPREVRALACKVEEVGSHFTGRRKSYTGCVTDEVFLVNRGFLFLPLVRPIDQRQRDQIEFRRPRAEFGARYDRAKIGRGHEEPE